ncbi:MAG: transglycosylase SLT domain-containing protein [Gemmatimonadota bacterium]
MPELAHTLMLASTLGVGVIAGIAAIPGVTTGPGMAMIRGMDDLLNRVESRVRAAEAEAHGWDERYAIEVEPLVDALTLLRDDRAYATRIALGLVREGRRTRIDPRLLLAVMTVENPWLELAIRSPMGAVGLMQVMPFHAGNWGCGSDDLTDLDANICHGAEILAHAIQRTNGDLDRALLRYNGCVRGTNTPDCHLYPSWVLSHPGLTSMGL